MKLKKWDEVRIINISGSFWKYTEEEALLKKEGLESYWLKVTYSKNIMEINSEGSSSVKSRVDDLHEAFLDKNVKMILCTSWWYSANELLADIDYEIIKNNPKIFMWFSDITTLNNWIYAKTWMKTFWGPTFSSFWKSWIKETWEYFEKVLFWNEDIELKPFEYYYDFSSSYPDKELISIKNREGFVFLNEKDFSWELIWWTINCIVWKINTPYFDTFNWKIAFLEYFLWSKSEIKFALNDLFLSWKFNPKALLFWRTMLDSKVTIEDLKEILLSIPPLKNIPIILNVDFWHTSPQFTFPVWWKIEFKNLYIA